jgi:prepilin signal peptidase PulO-like enzyme (type II secretory pathway)
MSKIGRWWVAAAGILTLGGVVYRFGISLHTIVNLPVVGILVLAAIHDLEQKIIPDWLTLPGLAWVFAVGLLPGIERIGEAMLGAVVCGGVLLLFALVSRGAVGGGDVKLLTMIGAATGWRYGLLALCLSQLCAGGVAVLLLVRGKRGRREALVFGPFLSIFGILAILLKSR